MKNAALSPGFDLMSVLPIRRTIRSRWFPYAIQGVLLLIFLWLALLGWSHYTPAGIPSKLYAKANLVNLLIWGLWWPVMIWVAVFFGRIWCAVCPMELVSNAGEHLARTARLPPGRLPGWIAGGGLIALLYIAVQASVAGLELHRVPAYTSVFLWLLLALALVSGVLVKDRAFCRGFCPVGLLLNVYGRGGILAVRRKTKEHCGRCSGRQCTAARQRYALDSRSCPSLLNPSKLEANGDCLLCGQCLKACPSNNLALRWRRPFAAVDRRPVLASWPITLFVMVVSGFVTYEMFSEWKAAQAIFLWPVEFLAEQLAVSKGATGWLKGGYTLLVVPAIVWLTAGGLTRLLGGANSLPEAWRRLALPMAVVIAGGHMAKALAKFVSWGGYLPWAIREPLGVETAQGILTNRLAPPDPWLSLSIVSLISAILIITAGWFAVREARLANRTGSTVRAVPIVLLAGFYLFLALGWGGWILS